MNKHSLGIYLGKSFASAILVDGNNIKKAAKFDLESLEKDVKEDMVNNDVLWEALVNRCVRELGEVPKDIFVSVVDKEFIFRCFDMPLMKRSDLEAALGYEIEKYIPFKVKDLIWDYSYNSLYRQKKVKLSFLGIKKNAYKKYKDLFNSLDLKVLNIEPSAIALARAIKSLREVKKINNFALLDFSKHEAAITFFSNELPLFNRYLTVSQQGPVNSFEKLIEEVRISIQYFERVFKNYNLDKLVVFCNEQEMKLFSPLRSEFKIDILTITPRDFFPDKEITLEHFKAYATAAAPFLPYRFRPIFMDYQGKLSRREKFLLGQPLFNFFIPVIIIIIGALSYMYFSYIINKKLNDERQFVGQKEEAIFIPDFLKNKNVNEIKNFVNKQKDDKEEINELTKDLVEVTEALETIPYLLTDGLWLRNFQFRKADTSKDLNLKIDGYVFLDDKKAEGDSLNLFAKRLRENEKVTKVFSEVVVGTITRAEYKDYDVLSFSFTLL
jgi:hypothetical protein